MNALFCGKEIEISCKDIPTKDWDLLGKTHKPLQVEGNRDRGETGRKGGRRRGTQNRSGKGQEVGVLKGWEVGEKCKLLTFLIS